MIPRDAPRAATSIASRIACSVLRAMMGSPVQPRLPARLLARARSFSLDGKLIAGADPACSTALAVRAAQLTSQSSRCSLADALEGLLQAVQQPRRRTRVRPEAATVFANESTIRRLAERLRSGGPLYARGIAHVGALLSNATSPVFGGDAQTLAAEFETAEAELDGSATPSSASGWPGFPQRRTPPVRLDYPRLVGGSFTLPNGSWYHTRREGS
jgi:hypothetical protein